MPRCFLVRENKISSDHPFVAMDTKKVSGKILLVFFLKYLDQGQDLKKKTRGNFLSIWSTIGKQ